MSNDSAPGVSYGTLKMWEEMEKWLRNTVIAMSLLNLIILILTVISYIAMTKLRRRCDELRLFFACMDRQLQRSVLPPPLVQKAIEPPTASFRARSGIVAAAAGTKIDATCGVSLAGTTLANTVKQPNGKNPGK